MKTLTNAALEIQQLCAPWTTWYKIEMYSKNNTLWDWGTVSVWTIYWTTTAGHNKKKQKLNASQKPSPEHCCGSSVGETKKTLE